MAERRQRIDNAMTLEPIALFAKCSLDKSQQVSLLDSVHYARASALRDPRSPITAHGPFSDKGMVAYGRGEDPGDSMSLTRAHKHLLLL